MSVVSRLKNAWNAFRHNEKNYAQLYEDLGPVSSSPQYRTWRYTNGSILDTIINKIAIDVSMIGFDHVKMDNDAKTEQTMTKSGLHECLTVGPNIDQTPLDFIQDGVFSMMDEGIVALVPVKADVDPNYTEAFDIYELRVGKIVQWYPEAVKVEVYDPDVGRMQQIITSKHFTAIIENPLYAVVNAPNSTVSRLKRKLALSDAIDEGNANQGLQLIIQLPYEVRGKTREKQAEQRVKLIEKQLSKNNLGIGYIGAQEKLTQLNRTIENTLLKQVEYLTNELYNQLGMSKGVFDGTATELEMNSYNNRTIHPIAKRFAMEMTRKFISKTGRTQGQQVIYHTDPFKIVPLEQLAGAVTSLKTQAILTSNECRMILGYQPLDDDRANQLFNPNIEVPQNGNEQPAEGEEESTEDLEVPDGAEPVVDPKTGKTEMGLAE